MIRSPFNFIPMNTCVFYPNWAKLITQDIPFQDGISGSIELTITADTPIFVRNGHTQKDNANRTDAYRSFSKYPGPDGRYFIPGASVKGAVRSVLEVLSMGKMHVDEHAMFAFKPVRGRKHEGWLHRGTDGNYYISVYTDNNVNDHQDDLDREIDYTLRLDNNLVDKYKLLYQNEPNYAEGLRILDTEGRHVYLRENRDGLIAFGVTERYKAPYKHSPYELAISIEESADSRAFQPDLAECIFGYTSERGAQQKDSLKGRVQFSNFVSDDAIEDDSLRLVLNGPKASYYPIYIRQDNVIGNKVNNYKDYNDGQLSGRKRYLLRDAIWQRNTGSNQLDTIVYPLRAGSTFKGSIQFHNLRPEELGALLSALTFHGNPNCHHQLGQAKPYGLGKVTFTIGERIKVPSYMKDSLKENTFYMALFENTMADFNSNWLYENSIQELFTVASITVNGTDPNYQYMVMDLDPDHNEFYQAQNEKFYLQDFSQRVGRIVTPRSQYTPYRDQIDTMNSERAASIVEAKRMEEERLAELELLEEGRKKEERLKAKEEAEAKKKAEAEAKTAEKSAAGLSLLDEMRADGKGYKITSFKQAKNLVERWQKAAGVTDVPVDQQPLLFATLQRLSKIPDKKEKNEWPNFDSKLWKEIIKYVSEETAQKWFNELIK